MAPTHNAVAVPADAQLVRKTVAALPAAEPVGLVEELLARLSRVKARRDARGLNHWEDYAPAYLERLLRRRESLHRRKVEAFFRLERNAAVARAEAMLGSREEAEDAVSEAFLRLLAGKTRIELFYRTLKLVCVDRLRERGRSVKLLASESEGGGMATLDASPASIAARAGWDGGCGDPLEILIRREEIQTGIDDILTGSEHRDTRRLDWWTDLLSHHRPKLVEGKGPAQTNR